MKRNLVVSPYNVLVFACHHRTHVEFFFFSVIITDIEVEMFNTK